MKHGSENHIVEYTYDKNEDGESTNIPVVQDGIVIQNATDGNEFVWVPVGEIKNDAVENTTNKTTITLGRYSNFTVTDGMLWSNITQPNAAIAAKAMYPYSSTAKYYSDLINSYAWDTAIIFIEAYSDATYATTTGRSINANIAKAGENADKRCNIQDMAGNTGEWSTETSTVSSAPPAPCTNRGGYYNSSGDTTSLRIVGSATGDYGHISFRGSLCVK